MADSIPLCAVENLFGNLPEGNNPRKRRLHIDEFTTREVSEALKKAALAQQIRIFDEKK